MPGGGVQEVLPRSTASVSRMGVLCRGRSRSQQQEKRQRQKMHFLCLFSCVSKVGKFGRGGGWGGKGVTLIVTPDFAASRFFSFQGAFLWDGFSCFLFLRLAPISLTRILKTPLSFFLLFFYLRRPIWESALCEMWSTFSLLPLSPIGRGNWNCPRKGRRRRRGVKIGGETVTEMTPNRTKHPDRFIQIRGLGLMDIHMENGNRCPFFATFLFLFSIRGESLSIRPSLLPPSSVGRRRKTEYKREEGECKI